MAFQEPITNKLLRYGKRTFGTPPEYLWARLPDAAVLRRPDNRKWYAVFMTVERKKLGLPGDGAVEVIDLKADPALIDSLLPRPGFFPAYHMNKVHWFSALLDGTVPYEDLRQLLKYSYACAGGKS
ncbi:MAG: MmcQ/YjbR family DNA-binding protein [Oscillospiraceae bacterium]|jgi:predicted DNA-binding protein (MmcQ/YjbR family)|nr:MmcQ/YjbR family DNA-binding protein [Oscillospiraceae bacterium]